MDERELERLPRFTWAEIKKKVETREPFEAISPMSTSLIRVKRYEPLMGLAIHAGHRVREELVSKMSIEEAERLYEEDAFVDEFISDFPFQMIGLDSRYEYDLNRPREGSVYLKPFQSWGKKVWRTPPSKEELEISYQKYDEFHELLDYLVGEFEKAAGPLVVLDVHSYNHKRSSFAGRQTPLPMFNLAVSENDRKKFGPALADAKSILSNATIRGAVPTLAENDVFKKDGAIACGLEAHYVESFVLPVEIKKVYMDEVTGDANPEAVKYLAELMSSVGRSALARLNSRTKA